MSHKILIADPDEAFGQMLQQMLAANGDYDTQAVTTGAHALAAAQTMLPDLAIIDLAIADMTPRALIADMRQRVPALRVMLIPIGDHLPDEFQAADIQGVLTKPFFIGDLGGTIARALGTETRPLVDLPPPPPRKADDATPKPRVRQATRPPAAHAPSPSPAPVAVPAAVPPPSAPVVRAAPRARRAVPPPAPEPAVAASKIDLVLAALATEVHADALLVMQNGAPLAQCSNLSPDRLDALLKLLVRWSQLAGEVASFVGEAHGRFRQLHFEGDRQHVYALEVARDVMLIVVCRSDVPFGTVRLACKGAMGEIAKLVR